MAKVRRNLLLQGLSGKLGDDLIIRQLPDGQTIVCAAPAPSDQPRSAAQVEQQDRFAQAAAYARAVLAGPDQAAPYLAAARRTGRHPNNLCVSDYLTRPALGILHPAGPPPAPLQLIVVNPVALRSVTVRLEHPDGTLLAEGPAHPQSDPGRWHYVPTPAPTAWAGLRAHLTLTNHPGHPAALTVIL